MAYMATRLIYVYNDMLSYTAISLLSQVTLLYSVVVYTLDIVSPSYQRTPLMLPE